MRSISKVPVKTLEMVMMVNLHRSGT